MRRYQKIKAKLSALLTEAGRFGSARRLLGRAFGGSQSAALLMVVCLLLPQLAHAAWHDGNWSYRKQITINSLMTPNTDQSHFPVLIKRATDAQLSASAQADGDDILFTLSDGITKLDHEIEKLETDTNTCGFITGSKTGLFLTGTHFPVDATTGWITGWDGLILKTTDGGGILGEAFHATGAQHQRYEVVFVDTNVSDYPNLVDDLLDTQDKNRQIDVVVLDGNLDGIDQISEVLAKHKNLDAVHIVSHGTDGAVQLGNSWLNSANIDDYSDSIAGWQSALNAEADLLFYGCDLAAGEDGQELIKNISSLTGADVAASDDLTGRAELGGNWVLEYTTGEIEIAIVLSDIAQEGWYGLLGEGWSSQTSGTTENLQSIHFPVDSTTGYVVGLTGTILKTTNGGSSWSPQASGGTNSLYDVYFPVDSTTGYIAGSNGTILKTTDGGSNWTPQTSGTTAYLFGVSFPTDATTGYIVGASDKILKTIDGGTNWTSQTSGTSGEVFYGVHFPSDAITGYAVGSSGTILKTTDGGSNWTSQTSGTNEHLNAVHFPVDATTGYAVGFTGEILKTTDGGSNWNALLPGSTTQFNGVYFVDNMTGYVVGGPGVVIKTIDGGTTWTQQLVGTSNFINDIQFAPDALNGFLISHVGEIFNATDGGDGDALHPTGAGSVSGFTVNGGVNGWDVVNDQTGNAGTGIPEANDGADYLTDGSGARHMFSLDNGIIPAGSTITSIQVVALVNKPGGGQKPTVQLSYQRMGTDGSPIDSAASPQIADATYVSVSQSWIGLSWSTTDLDNLEVGIVHASGGTVGVSQLYATVTYEISGYLITGKVFEDAKFAGTAADYVDETDDKALANVDVELYNNSDVYQTSVTTDVNGDFSFAGVADGTYKVRVRAATIADSDTTPKGGLNGTVPGTWPYPLPEMTWANGTAKYGGQSATADDTDTGDNAGPGDNWVSISVSGGNVTNVNMGFAYNLIVNVEDDGNADSSLSDQGSLRQFIKNANAIGSAGSTTANSSEFRMQVATNQTDGSGNNWWRTTLSTICLPELTDGGMTIDGSRQRLNSASDDNTLGPEIEIDGNKGSIAGCTGLYINNVGTMTIQEIVLGNFSSQGITMTGAGANGINLYGNYVGTDAVGGAQRANDGFGVWLTTSPSNINIGGTGADQGNIISGNGNSATESEISQSSGTTVNIIGNIIGLDRTGTIKLGNTGPGITISGGDGVIIGGSTVAARNLIAGNNGAGIALKNWTRNVTVQGNHIGTGITGTETTLGNGGDNIKLASFYDPSNFIIGGLATDEGNIITRSSIYGIRTQDSGTADFIQGNTIFSNTVGGIYSATDSVTIEKNNIYSNGGTNGNIQLVNDAGTGQSNNLVYNNTIHDSSNGSGIKITGLNAIIKNNIITGNASYGINVSGGSMTDAYNLITDNTTADVALRNPSGQSNVALDATTINTDPLFTNEPADDYTLQNTSPAINRGCDLGAAGDDTGCDTAADGAQPDLTEGANPNFYAYAPDLGAFENTLATTCVVLATADNVTPPYGSLRECINTANANPGTTIKFALGTGDSGYQTAGADNWWRISPTSALPAITADGTIVDGTSQTSIADSNSLGPEIEIRAPGTPTFDGFDVSANSSTIKGLIVNGFGDDTTLKGIITNGDSNTFLGNYIGTNYKGTNSPAVTSNDRGIQITTGGASNTIGGTTAADRNIISNNGYGIIIQGAGTTLNTVKGNYIGPDPAGTASVGNANSGILIELGATSNTIGGSTVNDRNIISGNPTTGIQIITDTTDGNIIKGNYIGVDINGADLGNTSYGIYLAQGDGTIIGGTGVNEYNVIAKNGSYGIVMFADALNSIVQGNYIGVLADGTTARGNGDIGILITGSSGKVTGTIVGGTNAGEANVIAYNTGDGVQVSVGDTTGTTNNDVSANSIFENTGLGINVGAGANGDKAAPTISSIVPNGSDFDVTVTIAPTSPTNTIEFFRVNNAAAPVVTADGSGSGEGYLFLGSCADETAGEGILCVGPHIDTTVIDANGAGGTVEVTLKASGLSGGDEITATATDATNGTSEFAINATTPAGYAISGKVFEDANFAGTAADYVDETTDNALENVDVELYDNSDVYQTSVSTDTNGSFTFSGLSDGTYKMRVRSATIADADTTPKGGLNGTVPGTWPYPLPEMTWANGTAKYGGQSATADDTATGDNAGPGDTWISVTVSGGNVTDVNMGFAYNLIVNVEDDGNADDALSDQGSLRQFLKNANAIGSAGSTTASSSEFRMQMATNQSSGADEWWRFTVNALNLPAITDGGTTLDGSTQRTNSATDSNTLGPEIELYGSNSLTSGLNITAGSNQTIQELVINSFTSTGITGGGATVDQVQLYGNYIGTNAVGSAAMANLDGIYFWNGGQSDFDIGGVNPGEGNLISGNTQQGIQLAGGSDYRIYGNYIGTNRDVSAKIANGETGIKFSGTSSVYIGGASAGQGNIISGNGTGLTSGKGGIEVGNNNTDAYIYGNTIGSGQTGSENLANADWGIRVFFANAASNLYIGGMGANEGNLIAYNANQGVYIQGTPTNVKVEGNTIRNNGGPGIYNQTDSVLIAGNYITGNSAADGIYLAAGGSNAKIYHNTIHGSGSDGIETLAADTIIKNNNITGSGAYGINVNGGAMTESNNDVTDNAISPASMRNASGRSNVALDASDINIDPQYTDYAGGDFTLIECASFTINNGVDLGADQPDLVPPAGDPKFNSTAPDMGAYETSCTGSGSDISIDNDFTEWCDASGNDFCVEDEGGANDWANPARLDITRFGVGSNRADSFYVLFGFDDTALTQQSTACVLIDTDNDIVNGYIDYAMCVVIDGSPTSVSSIELYACDDTISGGCGGASFSQTYGTYGFSNSAAGPWDTDSYIDVALPYSHLGATSGSGTVLLNTLISYPGKSFLKSPKDSVFGNLEQDSGKRTSYNIDDGNSTIIAGPGKQSVSGIVYSDEGTTPLAGKTVRLIKNGVSVGTDTTGASGEYFISEFIADNDNIIAYIDGDDGATDDATTVTVFKGTNLTGLDAYKDHLIVRHDNAGSLTNALMKAAENGNGDDEILFDVDGDNNLTVEGAATELYVPTGHTYVPGANVDTVSLKIVGILTAGSNTITVSGNWDSSAGTFNRDTSTLVLNGTSNTFTPKDNQNFHNMTIGAGADITVVDSGGTDNFTVYEDLTINGTLDLAGFDLSVNDVMTVDANGTLQLEGGQSVTTTTTTLNNGSTVLYDGAGSYTGLPVGNNYHHVTFNGSGTWTLDAALDVNGNLTITSGTLDVDNVGNHQINVAGNWGNSGTFEGRAGTVVFDGTGQAINGSATFYNLTKSVASADTLTFEASQTTTIATGGTVTLNGASGQLLTLASSTGSSAWNFTLNSGVTKAIDYVSVSWSDASGSDATLKPIAPTNSTNDGDNVDWFGDPVITVTKLSTVVSDPINGASNPKRIPGAIIKYTVMPSNSGDASPDANSTVVTDALDSANVSYDVTTGVSFTDGATSSGLALGSVTFSSTAAPGPYVYDYTPSGGYDDNVTSIKITTTGTFANGGAPAPSFNIEYRIQVK